MIEIKKYQPWGYMEWPRCYIPTYTNEQMDEVLMLFSVLENPTIKNIAKRSGISFPTVSKMLDIAFIKN